MRALSPISEFLRFLLPSRCLGCASPLALDAPQPLICSACASALREPPWPRCPRCHFPRGTGRSPDTGCLECAHWPDPLVGARACAVMEPPADTLVHALKYGGWRELADPMAERMVRLCGLPGRVVVPVPTTAGRTKLRGYNQAALLASAYARALDAPLVHALVRVREGPSQISLAPDQRKSNVDGAFQVRSGEGADVGGREVALVDDVLTTGSVAIFV